MTPDRPIAELFSRERPLLSMEFFPPKDEEGFAQLRQTASALKALGPDFVSVTYGAGGSTRERTALASRLLKEEFGLLVMPHLTCVGASRKEIGDVAAGLHQQGYRNVMALRGDPPKGETRFQAAPDGLRYAGDLVRLLKQRFPEFCLGVAGYPEKHPEAPSLEADLEHLKRKVEAGASFVTTQLFFDNAAYFRFVDACRQAGIEVPILPGIMPVLSLKQIRRFTEMCGASLPKPLTDRLEAAGDDQAAVERAGIDWAYQQVQELLAQGVPGYHLYVLNRARSALALAEKLSQR